ncbi:MAG: hypothetical protein MJY66_00355 [Bacteroidaceae bacterium]|nr:hypothetical protein [Bacteroidaceae bacterium]
MKGLAVRALLFIPACIFLVGCGRQELLQVERIMESDVLKADSMISTMEEPAGRRNLALYSILRTQIDYKLYRKAESDSLIRTATDYYGKGRKSYHAAMAWYSLGCVAGENGDDVTAVDAYLNALSLFPDTLVRYFALSEQNLGIIYLNHHMDEEVVDILRSCRFNSIRLKDSTAIALCDYVIATNLFYHKEFEKARAIFNELKENRFMSYETMNCPYIQLAKISVYNDSDYVKGIEYIDTFLIRNRHRLSEGPAFSVKADAYNYQSMTDSAVFYYNLSILETDDPYTICSGYDKLSDIYSDNGDYASASLCSSKATEWMDSISSISNSDNLFRTLVKHSSLAFRPGSGRTITYALACLIIITVVILLRRNSRGTDYSGNTDISDYQFLFNQFKQGPVYNEMLSVISKREEQALKTRNLFIADFRNSLIEPRNFLISTYGLSVVEVDLCIFVYLGFQQKYFPKFFNMSPSGVRTLKQRIKQKLPEPLFSQLFFRGQD